MRDLVCLGLLLPVLYLDQVILLFFESLLLRVSCVFQFLDTVVSSISELVLAVCTCENKGITVGAPVSLIHLFKGLEGWGPLGFVNFWLFFLASAALISLHILCCSAHFLPMHSEAEHGLQCPSKS